MLSWMDAEAKLAEIIPNFQPRENQRALALQAEQSLLEHNHLLAEAGTGTGKSFVGLISAYNLSQKTGKPAVYATGTKALQDQVIFKDGPLLQQVIPDLKIAAVKGRGNYVCMAKVQDLPELTKAQVEEGISHEDFTGEAADLSFEGLDLTSTTDECPGKRDCPFGDVCFAERAKQRARESHVIVVNHALLAIDTAIKEAQLDAGVPEDKATGTLPPYVGGVLDEAHEFEDYVTSALGEEITAGSLGRLGKDIANFLGTKDAAKTLIQHTDAVYAVVKSELAKRKHKNDKNYRFTADSLTALSDPIWNLLNTLTGLSGKIEFAQVYGDDKKVQKQKRLVKRIKGVNEKLRMLMTADFTEMVRWFNVAEGLKGESIQWAPLSVANFLRNNLWNSGPFMLMSATLAVNDSFDFIGTRLGIDEHESLISDTPFDFKTQAMTYVAQLAHPVAATKEQWRAGAIAAAGELVRASNGRALFLYTSRNEMQEAHRILGPMIERMGHRVLKQGDAPNKVLSATFKEDEHSCLFALKSFFTGIDIQGDSLRLVVMDKAMFPVPTDVIYAARCEAIDKGGNPFGKGGSFWTYTLPLVILIHKQGYGRLIRTVDDWGVVAFMDARLFGKTAKSYGSKIMTAMPPAPVTTELSEAVTFLEQGVGA